MGEQQGNWSSNNWSSKQLWAVACDLWAALGGASEYGKWNSKGGTSAESATYKWGQKGERWTPAAATNAGPKKYQSTPYQSTPLVPKIPAASSKGRSDMKQVAAGQSACKWCQQGECWTHQSAPMKGAGKNQSAAYQVPQLAPTVTGMLGSKIQGLAAPKQPAVKAVLHGTAGKATDRSRTPMNRTAKQQ